MRVFLGSSFCLALALNSGSRSAAHWQCSAQTGLQSNGKGGAAEGRTCGALRGLCRRALACRLSSAMRCQAAAGSADHAAVRCLGVVHARYAVSRKATGDTNAVCARL